MDTITISSTAKGSLLKFVESSLEAKNIELDEARKKIESIENELSELKELEKQLNTGSKEENDLRDKEIRVKEPAMRRTRRRRSRGVRGTIRDILSENKSLFSTDDFIIAIDDVAPDLFHGKNRDQKRTSISGSLSGMFTSGELDRIENPLEQGFLYGFKEWFNDENWPKEVYAENTKKAGYNIDKVKYDELEFE